MARIDDTERLAHMLDYARMAQTVSQGRTREHLDTDTLFSLGVVRALEVVGEAANRVSPAGRQRLPNIPWPKIIGLRNRIVHGYDLLDRDVIWRIISHELQPLIAQLEKVVQTGPPQ